MFNSKAGVTKERCLTAGQPPMAGEQHPACLVCCPFTGMRKNGPFPDQRILAFLLSSDGGQ